MRKWLGRSLPDKSRITSVFHIWRLPRDWKYRFYWHQPVQLVINSSLPRNTAEPAWSWWKFIKKRKNFDIFKNGKKLLANQRSKIRTLLNNNNILKISVFSKCYGVKNTSELYKAFFVMFGKNIPSDIYWTKYLKYRKTSKIPLNALNTANLRK